jgi:hypothetical protein
MATYKQIYSEAIAADDAWSAELTRLFGKQAGDKRYTKEGKGEEGSELRRLHNNKRNCDDALGAYYMSTEACGF